MKEFIQKFRWIVRESNFEERLLIREFKRDMNKVIQRKLIEVECPLRSIEK